MPNKEKLAQHTRNVPSLAAIIELIKLLREGPAESQELMKAVKASRRTFYRALSALKEAGVAKEQEGYYYWYEHLETMEYQSDFEAERALKHSEKVASGLAHLLGGRSYFVERDLMPKVEYAECALMHLRTGYREAYEIFKKTEDVRKRMVDEERRFREGVKARLLSTPLKLLERHRADVVEIVAENVCRDIKEALRGREPRFLTNLKVDEEKKTVMSGTYTLAGKDEFEPLKQFITEEETSKVGKDACRRIVELENQYYTLRKSFEEPTELLIRQVLNGTPLKGKCNLCPKVRVIKSSA